MSKLSASLEIKREIELLGRARQGTGHRAAELHRGEPPFRS
jgi:hypothetical protein